MKIEQFRIKDFKSIKELVIDDLNAINIFYGLNDAGKSNIFQAFDLWRKIFAFFYDSKAYPYNSLPYNHRTGSGTIELECLVSLNLTPFHVNELTDLIPPFSVINNILKVNLKFIIQELHVSTEVHIITSSKELYEVDKAREFIESIYLPQFFIIDATRRVGKEYWQQTNKQKIITTDKNLKQNLFYAYLSRDFQHKQRFEAVKNVLAQEPFQLGVLDVALDPQSNEIDVGFVQQNNRLPIEQFGSGTQQLLLMLGQLFLNNYPLVALEEPEMNLSPTHQANLISTLQKLMQEPTSGLKQLFISTHSPYLEFTENAYHVFRGEDGWTQVKKVSQKEAENYFALENRGEENGARLNSQNQITLRDNIVQDLNLERGDFVFVLKNEETGRWELHTEEEVLPKLKEAWQD